MAKNEKKTEEKLLVSIKEACEMTGVSERAMRDLSYNLNIQVRIGKRILIHKEKLKKWINEQVS